MYTDPFEALEATSYDPQILADITNSAALQLHQTHEALKDMNLHLNGDTSHIVPFRKEMAQYSSDFAQGLMHLHSFQHYLNPNDDLADNIDVLCENAEQIAEDFDYLESIDADGSLSFGKDSNIKNIKALKAKCSAFNHTLEQYSQHMFNRPVAEVVAPFQEAGWELSGRERSTNYAVIENAAALRAYRSEINMDKLKEIKLDIPKSKEIDKGFDR